jgi:hypothetical protein
MRAGIKKCAQARGGFRDGVRPRDADRVEAASLRSLCKLGFQRSRRQKSRSA